MASTRCIAIVCARAASFGYSGIYHGIHAAGVSCGLLPSCMHLKCLLGTRHFSELTSSTEDTIALLSLLALDVPDHVVCSPCKRLHSMKNLRRYNSCTAYQYADLPFPACVTEDRNNRTSAVAQLFGATAFKMAVKIYHQQPANTQLLNIMSSKAAKTVTTGNYVW